MRKESSAMAEEQGMTISNRMRDAYEGGDISGRRISRLRTRTLGARIG